MRDLLIGLALAVTSSSCFNLSTVLQASEARALPLRLGLRPALLGALVRRRGWLAATALGLLAAPMQVLALALAPIAVVQTAEASGLILLLLAGSRMLGEPAGRRERLAITAIVVAVLGVALTGIEHRPHHAPAGTLLAVLAPLAALALAPYALRSRAGSGAVTIAAGLAFGITAFALKLVADQLHAGDWAGAAGWASICALLGVVGMSSEMSALQLRRVARVAPVVFVLELLVPVILGPLVGGESWPAGPGRVALLAGSLIVAVAGAAALGSSPAIARVLGAARGGGEAADAQAGARSGTADGVAGSSAATSCASPRPSRAGVQPGPPST